MKTKILQTSHKKHVNAFSTFFRKIQLAYISWLNPFIWVCMFFIPSYSSHAKVEEKTKNDKEPYIINGMTWQCLYTSTSQSGHNESNVEYCIDGDTCVSDTTCWKLYRRQEYGEKKLLALIFENDGCIYFRQKHDDCFFLMYDFNMNKNETVHVVMPNTSWESSEGHIDAFLTARNTEQQTFSGHTFELICCEQHWENEMDTHSFSTTIIKGIGTPSGFVINLSGILGFGERMVSLTRGTTTYQFSTPTDIPSTTIVHENKQTIISLDGTFHQANLPMHIYIKNGKKFIHKF